VNDILDENVERSHNFILSRLNNKSNWITEFTIMKKTIPKEWVEKIKTENPPPPKKKGVVNI
jgi:dsDNA-specific endonuclease/ATPase MutS2